MIRVNEIMRFDQSQFSAGAAGVRLQGVARLPAEQPLRLAGLEHAVRQVHQHPELLRPGGQPRQRHLQAGAHRSPAVRKRHRARVRAEALPDLRGLRVRESGKEAAEDVDRVVLREDVQDLQAQTFREAVC